MEHEDSPESPLSPVSIAACISGMAYRVPGTKRITLTRCGVARKIKEAVPPLSSRRRRFARIDLSKSGTFRDLAELIFSCSAGGLGASGPGEKHYVGKR